MRNPADVAGASAPVPEALAQAEDEARRLHAAGRLDLLEPACERVLALRGEHAEALALLGLVRLHAGRFADAVPLLSRSVAAEPRVASVHLLLGQALGVLGQLDAAAEAFQRSLELDREQPALHDNLAALQLARGDAAKAADTLLSALARWPDRVESRLNLAVALKALGRLPEAVEACRQALEQRPGFPEALYTLSGLLQQQGRLDEAVDCCQRALDARPEHAETHNRLGTLCQARGHLEAAVASYERAAALSPAWFLPHFNLGQVHLQRDEPEPAITRLRESLRREPAHAQSHLDLAVMLLKAGRPEEGWREYEWRFGTGGQTPVRAGCDAPLWRGEPVEGRTLMVWHEQGLGDSLQFLRYTRRLHALGAKVWLQTPAPLTRLYRTCPWLERVVAMEVLPPGADFQVPLLSLPRLLGPIPDGVPYLEPPERRLEDVPGLAPPSAEELRIGCVWASSPANPAARTRDCDVAGLERLARLPGVRLFSLQFGPRAADLARASGAIRDLSPWLGDFADTAALVRRLDLVITVDTAMAHLAGALGQRVWTLLGAPADWRWGTTGERSPWYPTMRLFRQSLPGCWDTVFDDVERALRAERP
jgi:tetratricopeptide (TPR) repeat protein